MKKITIVLVVSGILMACQKEDNVCLFNANEHSPITKNISIEEAIQIAKEGALMLEDSLFTRFHNVRSVDCKNIKPYIKAATRADEEVDTLFYVVNYADSAGFALVSTSRIHGDPLLAVTEQGSYTPFESTENDGFNYYIDMLASGCEGVTESELQIPVIDTTFHGFGPFEELTYSDWDTYGPYIDVKWGQSPIYNRYCYVEGNESIQSKAGCVAVAIGQIMTYHQHPSSYVITFDETSRWGLQGTTQTPNWSAINQHRSVCYNAYCSIDEDIARLLREIGERANMNYYSGHAGSNIVGAQSCFANMGYQTPQKQAYNRDVICSELALNRPVFLSGFETGGNNGHAWVIDGYKSRTKIYRTYYIQADGSELNWIYDETEYTYFHFNWGWHGDCNGYFQAGVFDTQEGFEYDSSSIAGYNGNYQNQILIGISEFNN
ncbi:MAG: hypothetical protein E7149_03725 [Rikenellaceae bacterium]|nr:hypothetical protein [Rikenellaceae bacterium]